MFLAFICQKNRKKFESTTTEQGSDSLLEPVIQSANLVWDLRNTPDTSDSTQIYHYFTSNKLHKVKQSDVLNFVRTKAYSLGERILGFHPSEISNKSIHSGADIVWYLGGSPA